MTPEEQAQSQRVEAEKAALREPLAAALAEIKEQRHPHEPTWFVGTPFS